MWTSWSLSAESNKAGDVPNDHDHVEKHDATQPPRQARGQHERNLPSRAQEDGPQDPAPEPTGRPWSKGSQGAPATIRTGAKNMIRMCSTMWTKK